MTDDPHEARMALGTWFMTMVDELEEDFVDDPQAIENLQACVAEAFAEWRSRWGYGLQEPQLRPEPVAGQTQRLAKPPDSPSP